MADELAIDSQGNYYIPGVPNVTVPVSGGKKLTPVDYDPFADQPASYDAPVFSGDDVSRGAEMRPYQPTLREKFRALLMGDEKPSPERRRVAEGLTDIVGMTPAGIPMASEEAKRDVNRGAYGSAALNAMAMIPGAPLGTMAAKTAAPTVGRVLNEIGLFSHGAETAAALPQAKGTPEQIKAMLIKGGVKGPELEGFDTAFAGKGAVTRDEVRDWFQGNLPQVSERTLGKQAASDMEREYNNLAYREPNLTPEEMARYQELEGMIDGGSFPQPKFSQYTLPGGENYREVLLKLPESPYTKTNELQEFKQILPGINTVDDVQQAMRHNAQFRETVRGQSPEQILENVKLARQGKEYQPPFKSSHWDDPNVVAHLRMADRTAGDEKVLHLEELQSDWGQQGRSNGFGDKQTYKVNNPDGTWYSSYSDPMDAEEAAKFVGGHIVPETTKGIPPAPYVTNTTHWTDLGLKRALKEAADGGYDRLTWTPGAEQAKRYDLSKQIQQLEYDPQAQTLNAYKPGGAVAIQKENVKPEELPDIVGKDVAKSLLESKQDQFGLHKLEGQQLSIGGEGMKSYYDKIVPTRLKELVKKLDPEAKIEFEKFAISRGHTAIIEADLAKSLGISVEDIRAMSNEQRKQAIQSVYNAHLPSIRITPKMREAIKKGLPAFSIGGIGVGSVLSQDGKHVMTPVDHDPFEKKL